MLEECNETWQFEPVNDNYINRKIQQKQSFCELLLCRRRITIILMASYFFVVMKPRNQAVDWPPCYKSDVDLDCRSSWFWTARVRAAGLKIWKEKRGRDSDETPGAFIELCLQTEFTYDDKSKRAMDCFMLLRFLQTNTMNHERSPKTNPRWLYDREGQGERWRKEPSYAQWTYCNKYKFADHGKGMHLWNSYVSYVLHVRTWTNGEKNRRRIQLTVAKPKTRHD